MDVLMHCLEGVILRKFFVFVGALNALKNRSQINLKSE